MNIFDHVEKLISKGELVEAERLLLAAPVSNIDDQVRQKLLLGEVYYEQNRWVESIELFESILPHVDKEQLSFALYHLAISNLHLDKPKDAILYGQSYLSLAKEMDIKENDIVVVCMHRHIAVSYAELGDLEKAELYMAGMKAGCNTPLIWLQYYTSGL